MRSIFQKRCWQAPLLAGRSRPHGRPQFGELGLPGGLSLAVRRGGDKADRLLLPGDALLERKIPPAAQLEEEGLHLVAARTPSASTGCTPCPRAVRETAPNTTPAAVKPSSHTPRLAASR